MPYAWHRHDLKEVLDLKFGYKNYTDEQVTTAINNFEAANSDTTQAAIDDFLLNENHATKENVLFAWWKDNVERDLKEKFGRVTNCMLC